MANKKIVLMLILTLIVASPAIALDVQEYEERKNTSRDVLKIYINGVGEGYSWSNSILKQRGNPPLYCPPQKIALNADNYMAIIDAQIAKMKKSGAIEIPVELILYLGLVDSFPCSK